MFCDLAGFTALSEHVEAERLVQFLNAYFSLMAGPITATGGVIDKYIGDAVMAYWCPPFVPREEVARRSAEAALLCLAEIPALAAAASEIFGSGHPYQPRIRIGIASGESIAGSIGAADRRNYTVIGDPVNLACRLEGTNRVYGTANLVCCRTAKALRATFELREVDTVLLPGLDVPEILIEILGRIGEVSAAQTELRDEYERGLEAYRSADWQAAFHQFAYCLDLSPEDGPTRTMLKRIERLAAMPATAGSWSGVWRLSKDDLL
jgi:adenylate cyclase